MQRVPFKPTVLPDIMRQLLLHLANSNAPFPFCRLSLEGRLDYELLIRARLYKGGERAHVAGLEHPSACQTSWVQMSGYRSSGGVFLHIVPETGSAGIVLPMEAFPVYAGPSGLAWDGGCSDGLFLFRRNTFPRGRSLMGIGHGIMSTDALGFTAASMLRAVEEPGKRFRVPCRKEAESAYLCRVMEQTKGLHEVKYDGLGVTFRPSLFLYDMFHQLVKGVVPDEMLRLDGAFWSGAARCLSLESRYRTKDLDKAVKLLRFVWRSGGGADTHIAVNQGELLFSRTPVKGRKLVVPLPTGKPVSGPMLERLKTRKDTIEWIRSVAHPDMRWVHCKVERIVLSTRTVLPVTDAFAVHPAGLVYKLSPGEPFSENMP